jgi:cobalt-zinc-cadmium efflux system outer membrane protein
MAAEPPPLSALVSEALAGNPERQYYEAELSAARALRATAGLPNRPEISGSLGSKRTHDPAAQVTGEGVAWSVGASQTFEWPGRLSLRKAIASRDVALAELGYARFTNALASRVRLLILTVAGAHEQARVAEEVAARVHALRDVFLQRDPAGIAPALELRILEAMELTTRRRITEAHLAGDAARIELNQLGRRPVDSPLEFEWSDPSLGPVPPVDSLIAASQTNNFDIRSLVVELEQQGYRVALARNERWPSWTVGPHYTEENSVGQDRVVGLSVSFPLPLWKNNTANVDASKARRVQAEASLAIVRREVERRVATAARNYATRLTELFQWRGDAVKQFQEAADLADRHYRLGAVPSATYVELQKQYLDAVETLIETRRRALESAQELEQLTGIPLLESSTPGGTKP